MSWESPIKVDYVSDIIEKITDEEGVKILGKVRAIIDVDKEELLRALAYDRKQYEKGFEEGREDVLSGLEAFLEQERERR